MSDRVVVDPAIHLGKPCVRGTRIPVHCVLEVVEQGIAFSEITEKYYPELTIEDVRACVGYAAAVLRDEETYAA